MKKYLAILLSILMLLGAFGCSSKPADEEEEILVIKPEEHGDTTLRLASCVEREESREIMTHIAEKYSYDYPNITVEIDYFDTTGEVAAAMLGGGYDAFEIRGENELREYVNENKIVDLSEYMSAWDEYYSVSLAGKTAAKTVEKIPYIFPYAIYQDVLYYRADVLEELEIDPPRHWKYMFEVAKELKELDITGAEVDIALAGNSTDYQFVDTMYWSAIGFDRIDKPSAAYYMYANKELGEEYGDTIFATEEAEEVLDYYKKLETELNVSTYGGQGENAAIEAFANKEANFLIAGPEALEICEELMEDDEWHAVPYPITEGVYAVLVNDFSGWGITEDSKNADLAAHFLMFMCNSDNNTYLARNSYFIPVHSDAIEHDDYFADSKFWAFTSMGKRTTAYRYATQPRMFKAFPEYEAMIDDKYEDFLNDKISSKDLLDELDTYWRAAFDDEGRIWR